MASFDIAYDWMMDNEDAARKCASVPDPVAVRLDDSPEIQQAKRTARAISGINSFSFPTDFAAIVAIDQASREPAVKRFYQLHFWNTYFEQLSSDEVAKRIFDEAVNAGSGTAVRLAQSAVGPSATKDGVWGPITLAGINAAAPDAFVAAYKRARVLLYETIALKNPALAGNLEGWKARANK